jgi:DNA-binding LacI/PurR family transcriptional regulator
MPPVRWEALCRQIVSDMSAGVFGFNQVLPARKELRHRYGVAGHTLRRALSALSSDGFLEPFRRSYRAATHAAVSSRNRIGLFLRATESGEVADFNGRTRVCLHAVEQECLAHNVTLRPFPCYYTSRGTMEYAGMEGNRPGEVHDAGQFLGFMLIPSDLDPPFLSRLVRRLVRLGKPLTCLWDNVMPEPLMPDLIHDLIRHFITPCDFNAGKTVGRYLLAQGHRRIRYFRGAEAERGWEEQRLDGIRHAYEDAGLAGSVSEFVCGLRFPSEDDRTGGEPHVRAAFGVAASAARAFEERVNLPMSHTVRSGLDYYLIRAAGDALLRSRLMPALKKALDEKDITAWVGMNDATAIECLHFLRNNGASTGHLPLVVGFDDSPEASYEGLSSYCFNGQAAVHAMMEHILRPGGYRAKATSRGPVVVTGFVHERDSR